MILFSSFVSCLVWLMFRLVLFLNVDLTVNGNSEYPDTLHIDGQDFGAVGENSTASSLAVCFLTCYWQSCRIGPLCHPPAELPASIALPFSVSATHLECKIDLSESRELYCMACSEWPPINPPTTVRPPLFCRYCGEQHVSIHAASHIYGFRQPPPPFTPPSGY